MLASTVPYTGKNEQLTSTCRDKFRNNNECHLRIEQINDAEPERKVLDEYNETGDVTSMSRQFIRNNLKRKESNYPNPIHSLFILAVDSKGQDNVESSCTVSVFCPWEK